MEGARVSVGCTRQFELCEFVSGWCSSTTDMPSPFYRQIIQPATWSETEDDFTVICTTVNFFLVMMVRLTKKVALLSLKQSIIVKHNNVILRSIFT